MWSGHPAGTMASAPAERGVGPRLPRIVALGGGTGLPGLLLGLKRAYFGAWAAIDPAADRSLLTAIVTVADDGGSSGRLRRQYQVPPPGDIRNCLLALAEADPRVLALFDFRFPGNGDVGGHSLGNLILTALSEMESGFHAGVQHGASLLGVRGQVLPATDEPVTLSAEFIDGSTADGESAIAGTNQLIRRLTLHPQDAAALPAAVEAIESADAVVIAPGSLYTSLIAILLVKDIADALARRHVPAIMVMNLMTEPGETDGYTAVDHVLALRRHAPDVAIRDIVLHSSPIPADLASHYTSRGSHVVRSDRSLLAAMGYRLVEGDLLATGPKVRHDPDRLAAVVIERALEAAR